MNDKFCFPVELREGSKVALFQSSSGEDYCINFVVTKSDEIVLNMQWMFPNKNLIKADLLTDDFELISSQTKVENGSQVHFKFCVNLTKRLDESSMDQNTADERNLIFIISVIPYIETKDCVIKTGKKEEVSNINDEKVRDLSEDLLVGLAMDMRDLLLHGDLSDAIIINGKHELKVHTAILSARSPVFRSLFKDPSNEKVITIPNASTEALNDMIVFIYSGLIKFKDIDRAEELYELAYKYELEDLHDACSVYMSNCTIDRVLQTLILADKHKDDQLKKYAMGFILKNFGELQSSEKWASFAKDNTGLTSEISSSINGPLEKEALCGFLSRLSAKKMKI